MQKKGVEVGFERFKDGKKVSTGVIGVNYNSKTRMWVAFVKSETEAKRKK